MVDTQRRVDNVDTLSYKASIKSGLKKILEDRDKVLAVWEGGSAATGFEDDYSDLDLAVVCKDDYVENVFTLIEDYLTEHHGISNRFRMPEPTWHDHSQCFYSLENSPKYYYVDLAVMKETSPNKLTESDRHGYAVVWFDKKNLIDTSPTPDEDIYKNCRKFFDSIQKGPLWLWVRETRKNCERGRYVDAKTNYDAIVHRNLAGLLNLKYRRNKYDFGLRYSSRDYPPDVFKKVSDLLFLTNPDELAVKLDVVLSMIHDLTEELSEVYKL